MILILDNYDSFTYNLAHACSGIGEEIVVKRNDELKPQEAERLNPRALILSPGPGRPNDAGFMEEYIDYFKGKIPILGICLGHQAICEVFGGDIVHAGRIMHGMRDRIEVNLDEAIFEGLKEKNIEVGRYHSLAVDTETFPNESLDIIAMAPDGEVMGVRHKEYDIWGLQFHPESIMTPDGDRIMENFLKMNSNNKEEQNDTGSNQ